MALLHSTAEPSPTKKESKKTKDKENKLVTEFLDSVLTDYDKANVTVSGDRVGYFTPDFPVPSAYFSCGVTVGEIKKSYILPHHQFFMAMGDKFKRKIDLDADSPELMKYLHGEEISADTEKGWAVVTVNSCPVGGVKVVSGRGKNHYPKGLRLK